MVKENNKKKKVKINGLKSRERSVHVPIRTNAMLGYDWFVNCI